MDLNLARRLSQLTSEFYKEVDLSFSATREEGWPGWERVLELLPRKNSLRVLDLACGNLRFERMLAKRGISAEVWAYDNCEGLVASKDVPQGINLHFHPCDIAEKLNLQQLFTLPSTCLVDLSVCFAFFHHLPLFEQRVKALQALLSQTRPGGLIALSLWQLEKSERLLAKAQKTTEQALKTLSLHGLGEHDYLLGWQNHPNVWRYCHSFTEDEIDKLAASASEHAKERARFSADGKDNNLNQYLILQKLPR